MDNRKHSLHSPSRWPALIACGFYSPAEGESEAATKGTVAHKLLELMLETLKAEGSLGNSVARVGAMTPEDASTFGLTGEEYALVDEMVINRAAECATYIAAQAAEVTGIEQRVTVVDGIYGFVDCVYVDRDGVTTILDFKTFPIGEKDYWAQLAAYAYGIMSKDGLEQARLVIDAGDGRQELVVEKKWCKAQFLLMMASVAQAEHGYSKPSPNPWCKYCRYAGACNGQTSAVERATPPEIVNAEWESLRPVDKANAMDLAQICTAYAEMVKELALNDLKSGRPVPGWKLQTRKGARRMTDFDHARVSLVANGVHPEDVDGARKLSLQDATALLKYAGHKGKALDAILDEFTYRAPDCTSIVRAKD